VAVADVEEAIRVHAARYLRRVYTSRELRDCVAPSGAPDARRLAARFAAKEAALKVLRGGDEPVPWRAIGVRTDALGRPSLHLDGAAAALARARGFGSLHLTLTEEGQYAGAAVIGELRDLS
jgi:holo-[acyl-carrier protein] synthase